MGRYEVEAEIGRGAMGVVYLAHDPRVGRRVAVKALSVPPGLDADEHEEYRQRFLREAWAAGRLSHPGIVTIYDAGEDPERGIPFIAMEYVAGVSVKDALREEGRFEPERALAIAGSVAEALREAHRAGIVHRDVKPANVLLREGDGAVKLADFGVARFARSELTLSGTTVGSPAYMSPEQIRGADVDGRSDLFSLAVILYEMLCGERPFAGEDTAALVYAIAHETPVPITERVAGLPRGLNRFFGCALAKDPAARFADAWEFGIALRAASREDDPAGERTLVDGDVAALAEPGAGRGAVPDRDGRARRHLRRTTFVAGALLVLTLGGWGLLGGKRAVYLQLDAKSSVAAGALTLLVDGEEVYSRALAAPVKRKGLLGKALGSGRETFEAWIEVSPGKHEVIARIETDDEPAGLSDTIVVDLEPGQTYKLKLVAGRALGAPVSLKID